jgi:ribosome-associated toxin RatA of RatAB toxin-antitoxin module
MAKTKHNRPKIVFSLAWAFALSGFCCNNLASPVPALAADKDSSEIARTARLTDSPEAAAANIGKQIKNQMTAPPASLAKLYDYDPPNVKLSKASTEITIMAPQQYVWDKLTTFATYPKLFPRLKTCQVVKKEGDLVYIESLLKPQMFVSQPCQHTINDLEDKPDSLKWKLTDGNFKAVEGEWKLKSIDGGQHTQVKYTMEVDPGPLIPRPIIVMALKMVQNEAVHSVKFMVEQDYAASQSGQGDRNNISRIKQHDPEG